MAVPAKQNATYEDFRAVPEGLVAESLFGSLFVHPRPAPPHATAGSALQIELGGPFQKGRGDPSGWIFVVEPELRLGPHIVQPDLAGWRRERMPHMPMTAFDETPPDWIGEVLSPSTEAIDRGPKRRLCATYGSGHLWHLDPVARLLEVFALQDARWVLHESYEDSAEVRAPPFDAVPFQLADLWPLPPAPSTAV